MKTLDHDYHVEVFYFELGKYSFRTIHNTPQQYNFGQHNPNFQYKLITSHHIEKSKFSDIYSAGLHLARKEYRLEKILNGNITRRTHKRIC